jgi:oxepin-CoA hydrolase/3-oxo-5,6-dehydrosuberyl-CoA semialdehyde dehydrogenase
MLRIPFDVNDPQARDTFLRFQLTEAMAALRAQASPRWGKMTAQHMVEHLVWSYELSTGRVQVDCAFSEEQRERLKAFLRDNRPTPREFRNPVLPVDLPVLRYADLDAAKAALRVAAEGFFAQAGADPGARHMHPVFGPIGMVEWARSHFKHAYHHLLQFGLIDEVP